MVKYIGLKKEKYNMAIIDKEKENNLYLEKDNELIEISDHETLSMLIELLFDFSEPEDYESELEDSEIEEIRA